MEKECTSLFGAWINNIRSPRDISDHGKLLEYARRKKIFYLCKKEGVCGEWNSLYSDLEPRKLMSHGKVVGLGLWAEGKARKEVVRERVESWVIMLKTELDTTVNPFPWKRNALACLEHR